MIMPRSNGPAERYASLHGDSRCRIRPGTQAFWPVRTAELHSAERCKCGGITEITTADRMSAGRTDRKSVFRRLSLRATSRDLLLLSSENIKDLSTSLAMKKANDSTYHLL